MRRIGRSVRLGLVVCVIALSGTGNLRGAVAPLDSLQALFGAAREDSTRVRLLVQIASYLQDTAYATSLEYYEQALRLAARGGIEDLQGWVQGSLGGVHLMHNNNSAALKAISLSIQHYEKSGNNAGLARAYNNLSIGLRREGNYKVAAQALAESLKRYQVEGDHKGEAMAYNNLAQIYFQLGEYPRAVNYFTEYATYSRANGHTRAAADGENNIGATYFEMKEYTQALNHYYAALELYDSIQSTLGRALVRDNVGLILRQLGQMHDAIGHHLEAVALYDTLGDCYRKAIALGNLSGDYRNKGECQASLKAARAGLAIADSMQNQELQILLNEEVGYSLACNGQHREANEYITRTITQLKAQNAQCGREDLQNMRQEFSSIQEYVHGFQAEQADKKPSCRCRLPWWLVITHLGVGALGYLGAWLIGRNKRGKQS